MIPRPARNATEEGHRPVDNRLTVGSRYEIHVAGDPTKPRLVDPGVELNGLVHAAPVEFQRLRHLII